MPADYSVPVARSMPITACCLACSSHSLGGEGGPIWGSTGAGISLADTANRPIGEHPSCPLPSSVALPKGRCGIDAKSAAGRPCQQVTPKRETPAPSPT